MISYYLMTHRGKWINVNVGELFYLKCELLN